LIAPATSLAGHESFKRGSGSRCRGLSDIIHGS
jgi:hypothetical protein